MYVLLTISVEQCSLDTYICTADIICSFYGTHFNFWNLSHHKLKIEVRHSFNVLFLHTECRVVSLSVFTGIQINLSLCKLGTEHYRYIPEFYHMSMALESIALKAIIGTLLFPGIKILWNAEKSSTYKLNRLFKSHVSQLISLAFG